MGRRLLLVVTPAQQLMNSELREELSASGKAKDASHQTSVSSLKCSSLGRERVTVLLCLNIICLWGRCSSSVAYVGVSNTVWVWTQPVELMETVGSSLGFFHKWRKRKAGTFGALGLSHVCLYELCNNLLSANLLYIPNFTCWALPLLAPKGLTPRDRDMK